MTKGSKTDKGKGIATTSQGTKRRTGQQPLWPRPEGKPFDLPPQLDPKNLTRKASHKISGYENRAELKEWCDYHSVFYNGMLNVAMEPTRLLDKEVLREMGIEESVAQLIDDMGLGVMPYKEFDLYPDLTRQFLATCEMYDPDHEKTGLYARIYFFCNGRRHTLHVGSIGSIYGWDTIRYDNTYSQATLNAMLGLWETIAYGSFESREMKIARIGNPTLKMAAKALAHTFFCKEEADRVSKNALALLFTGLSQDLRSQITYGTRPVLDRIDMS